MGLLGSFGDFFRKIGGDPLGLTTNKGPFGSKIKELPGPDILETPWGPEMRSFLTNLMLAEYPLQEIPGMTDIEKQAQSVLADVVSGKAFADPRTSPLYAGLRRESRREEEEAAGELRRYSQLAGMGRSSPAAREEGKLRSQFADQRLSLLGSLFETERARDNPYTRMGAVQQYGGLPRQIAGQQALARYQQATAPYNVQSQLAQFMLGYQPWYQKKYRQIPSLFSQIAEPLGRAVGTAAKMGVFA
ncbi:MAG: hypothetical protein JRI34_04630 [Deltaproteobacteria bacterium]|nr:hypothetical protein [Deltaproteobacteria bacterium]